MEKLTASFALGAAHENLSKEQRKAPGLAPREGSARRGRKDWNLLVTNERLYTLFSDTSLSGSNEKKSADGADLHRLKQKSQVMLDLGTLEYSTARKEESLRSWAHYKIGLAKVLHNYNNLYAKFYRDLAKEIQSMNKASNLVYSSPQDLINSMRSVMGSMRSFMGMLGPMAQVTRRMNECNQEIMKLGQEVGPEGAHKVFNELSEKIQSYPDLPQGQSPVGRSEERPNDELMVGKFYQDWTIQSLRQGIDLMQSASQSIDKHAGKLRSYASLSRSANSMKTDGRRDTMSFSLPATFALKEGREGHGNEPDPHRRELDEVEKGMGVFSAVNRLELEIPDIMSDEMLKDPYLLSSEVLAQASLGKDITGLDDSVRVSSQAHEHAF
ncbi:MAG: hypothetical protein RDV48_13450 [Candidatus Eremiobacteraeota bacterium]|nr:hypothetical protein [Candidatus Eremiobacteraeota bacterium]